MSMSKRWEELLYQELNRDARHFGTMLWEIPTAIFLVNSFMLSLIGIAALPLFVQQITVCFGLFFAILLTWALLKVVKRALKRAEVLKQIEKKKGLPRYAEGEPWYLKAPLGYSMIILLMLFIFFLAYLLANPHFLGSVNN